tara:strand:+ start:136 stop:357 length:222 start_codon:yes stop_codon:yes gene_type:complete
MYIFAKVLKPGENPWNQPRRGTVRPVTPDVSPRVLKWSFRRPALSIPKVYVPNLSWKKKRPPNREDNRARNTI